MFWVYLEMEDHLSPQALRNFYKPSFVMSGNFQRTQRNLYVDILELMFQPTTYQQYRIISNIAILVDWK